MWFLYKCDSFAHLVDMWTIIQVLTALLHLSTGILGSSTQSQIRSQRFIRVATIQIDPFVGVNWSPGLMANERYEGLYIDLMTELGREMALNYQLYLVPDGKTGQLGENNGHWNGLIGELERGRADLALAPIVASEERHHVVNFIAPLSRVTLSLLSRDHRQRHLLYCVVLDSEDFYAIKSNDNLYARLRNHGIMYTNSIMEALDRTKEGSCNLIINQQLADYHADQEPCDLTAEPFHVFEDLAFSLAVRKGSDMAEQISAALDRLLLGGDLMTSLEAKWLRGACMRKGTIPTSLRMSTNTDSQRAWNKLIFSSVIMEPYLMMSTRRGVQYEGFIADLVLQIANKLSVDYEFRIQRRAGKRKPNGSWSGMIGQVLDKEVDVIASPFVSSSEIDAVLDFSRPYMDSSLSILVRAPDHGTAPNVLLEDLLRHDSYDFGIVSNSRLAKHLKESEVPIHKQLWRKLSDNNENRVTSLAQGLDMVRAGNFALLLASEEATLVASRQPCDLISIAQFLQGRMPANFHGLATTKGNPLMDHLNLAILSLSEEGALQALFHKWWNTDECVGFSRPSAPATTTTTTTTTTLTTNRQTTTTTTTIAKTKQATTSDQIKTSITSTPTTTAKRFEAILDFNLDAVLGLSTDNIPIPINESFEYEHVDRDRDRIDLQRIFFTSPVSTFKPSDEIAGKDPVETKLNESIKEFIGAMSSTVPMQKEDFQITPSPRETTNTTEKTRRRDRTRRPGKKRRNRNRKRDRTTPIISTTTTTTTTTLTVKSPTRSRDFDKHLDWFLATNNPRPDDYDNFEFNSTDNQRRFTTVHDGEGLIKPTVMGKPSSSESATEQTNTTKILKTTTVRQRIRSNRPTILSIFPITKSVSPSMDIKPTLSSFIPRSVSDHPSPNSTISANESSPSTAPKTKRTNSAVLVIVVIHVLIFGWPEPVPCVEKCHR